MAVGRVLIVVGVACLAAAVLGQTTPPPSDSQTSYLVNGSGVVYNDSSITFYLNGTSLGTIPIASAGSVSGAGGVGEDGEQYDQDDHDDQGDDKDKSKDDGKDEGKDDKDSHTIDLTKHNPTPAPGESEDETDVLADIFEELLDKPNPLDEIKIGRKFML